MVQEQGKRERERDNGENKKKKKTEKNQRSKRCFIYEFFELDADDEERKEGNKSVGKRPSSFSEANATWMLSQRREGTFLLGKWRQLSKKKGGGGWLKRGERNRGRKERREGSKAEGGPMQKGRIQEGALQN